MSDWGDETPKVTPHAGDRNDDGGAGIDDWGDTTPAAPVVKRVSGWRNDECGTTNKTRHDNNRGDNGVRHDDGEGGGGGYRERRDDGEGGGGGYRERRDDGEGGGGGYRGRRDDGEGGGGGGYRGRRDDGEGGGGGYRGRRDDGEGGGGGGYRGRRDDGEGGGGGGYRGRRDDGEGGGGGYRGRRDDGEGGGGGYRGRRDDGEGGGGGGYRGRRDDGEGGRGGGYRERRDDGEETEIKEIEDIVMIPRSYDRDTVSAFMDHLDLGEYSSLYHMRELRDYLMRAYSTLITQEWNEYKKLDQEQREQNALEFRQRADMSERINEYVNLLLEECDGVQQQQGEIVRETVQREENPQQEHVESAPTVVDATETDWPITESPLVLPPTNRRASYAMPGLLSPRSPQTQTTERQQGRRTGGRTGTSAPNLFLLPSRILELLSTSRHTFVESECPISLQPEDDYIPQFSPLSGFNNRFPRWLSENFLRQHEMRQKRPRSATVLRQELERTSDQILTVLSYAPQPSFEFEVYEVERPVSHQYANARETVRRLQIKHNYPDGLSNPLLSAGGGTRTEEGFSSLPKGINSYSSMTIPSAGMATNQSDPAAQLTPIRELPDTVNMFNNDPSADLTEGNAFSPAGFRSQSRNLIASTPLLAYRPRLSAIDEEQHQAVVEQPIIENLLPHNELVDSEIEIDPPRGPPRGWTSILRPRTPVINYDGMVGRRPTRNRRPPPPPPPLNRDEQEEQPISNQEIISSFLTNIIQATIESQNENRPSQEVLAEPTITTNPLEEQQDIEIPMLENSIVSNVNGVENALVPDMSQIPETILPIENLTTPPDRPIVTDMSIFYPPPFIESVINPVPATSGTLCPLSSVLTTAVAAAEPVVVPFVSADDAPAAEPVIVPFVSSDAASAGSLVLPSSSTVTTVAAPPAEDQFYRENLDNLSYLVQHADVLRLMVDHTKELSDQQQNRMNQLNGNTGAASSENYRSLPAVHTFDPNLILEADPVIVRLTHAIFGALIRLPRIDMAHADFVNNNTERAHAYQILFDLKSAGIADGERTERRRRDDNDMNNNEGGEDGGKKPREFYIPPEPTTDENEMFNSGIATGINFTKYDNIPIKVSGENPPQAIKTFEQAQLRKIVLENVSKSAYKVPTPIQKVSIPVIAAGRDLMACAQTGSGKTAAFLLPILSDILNQSYDLEIGKPHAIIVSPTRELAIQIYNEARKFAHTSYLKITIVYGGTSVKYQNECITKGCHILIATPGRLMDFVDRTFITFEDTRYVVLDEADRMLDMGFSESMRKIMHHQTMRPDHQTLMFSATFPEEIQRLAGEFLKDYIFVTIGVVGGACSDVTQTVYEVNKYNKRAKLMEILREGADGTIVFVETKRSADFLASFFSETEFPTTSIHGDRLQSQREQALCDFKKGKMKVLIATSVASRGLDIKNVSHVINFDMPSTMDDYVHRIGRTGRVGNKGRATSFFDPEHDRALAGDLVKILEGSGQEVPEFLRNMGGGGSFHSSKFGGFDVRGGSAVETTNLEEEENWD